MSIALHTLALDTFIPRLRTLAEVLDKGAKHAAAKGIDPAVLVNARLFPDMLPLKAQVLIACDQAKNGTGRLVDQAPPVFEDNESTFDELRARIAKTITWLGDLPATAFLDAGDRDIVQQLRGGRVLEMKGADYLQNYLLPNFYFHVVTAYAILRHNGVELGKADFMSHMQGAIRQVNPSQS